MVEFDTLLTDREKAIAIIASCPYLPATEIDKFYRVCAINIRCAGIQVDDGTMDGLIESGISVLGDLYLEIKANKVKIQ